MIFIGRIAFILLLVAPLASCMTPGEKKNMKDDIFNVQTRVLNLERLLADTSKDAKSTGENATKVIASTQAELDKINNELQRLHGDVDMLRVGVLTGQMPGMDASQQENSLAANMAKINERMEAIEQAQEELLDALKKAGLKGSKKSHKAAASVGDLQKAFDAGKFKQVTDDGPKLIKEGGDEEKEQARFLVAESYFKLGKLREAALKFNDFLEAKPSKKYLPQAKMRIADCFRRLGDGATAKVYYEELIKEFPDSDEAAKAKERLADSSSGNSKG